MTELEKIIQTPSVELAENLLGLRLWPAQRQILEAIDDDTLDWFFASSCHSSGKTKAIAAAILCFLLKNPPLEGSTLIIATAPTFDQIIGQAFSELKGLYGRVAHLLPGSAFLKNELRLGDDWRALAFTGREPERFQGWHAHKILVVIDEASGITNPAIFEAIESIVASGDGKIVCTSNPTRSVGYFADLFRNPPAKSKGLKISCFDTPNFLANAVKTTKDLADCDPVKLKTPAPAALSVGFAQDKLRRWGEHSLWFQVRILGKFVSQGVDSLFDLDDIYAALQLAEPEPIPEISRDRITVLVDPSAYGDDRFACLLVEHQTLTDTFIKYGSCDPIEVCDEIAAWLAKYPQHNMVVRVDVGGLGAPIYANLLRVLPGVSVEPFNGAESAINDEEYLNARAENFFLLADVLKNRQLAIRLDKELADDLIADLAAIRYKESDKGKLQILSKADIKKQTGGISPDLADALALWVPTPIDWNAPENQVASTERALLYGSGYDTKTPLGRIRAREALLDIFEDEDSELAYPPDYLTQP